MSFTRIDRNFMSQGKICKGWLYLPAGAEKPPIILMAHGLACEKDFRLPAFAEHFAASGMAVFLFDYRHFGESEGLPRNLVSYRRQLQDWEAAIAYLHTISEVNAQKMALWGTSYSGGHVISVAARHPELAAVSAHVPFADGMTSIKTMGLLPMCKAAGAGLLDLLHCLTFQNPYCIPVVGQPGTLAVMSNPGLMEGYLGLVPEGSSWENKLPARFALSASYYRPTAVAARIQSPVLLIMGERDTAVYPPSIRKMAGKIHDCTFIELAMGHFDSYSGELFARVVELQRQFLAEKLLQ